jgi:predicted Zn-dependent peptidase
VLGLPLDYYRGLADRVNPLTAAQVRQALLRHLDPNALRVVAVGDRAKIESQLAQLKLGPPVQLHPDGTPVAAKPRPGSAPVRPKH